MNLLGDLVNRLHEKPGIIYSAKNRDAGEREEAYTFFELERGASIHLSS